VPTGLTKPCPFTIRYDTKHNTSRSSNSRSGCLVLLRCFVVVLVLAAVMVVVYFIRVVVSVSVTTGGVVPLLHCDICPASYHMSCLPPSARASCSTGVPWMCPSCKSGRKPLYGDIVWVKYSNYRSTYITTDSFYSNYLTKTVHSGHSFVQSLCIPVESLY